MNAGNSKAAQRVSLEQRFQKLPSTKCTLQQNNYTLKKMSPRHMRKNNRNLIAGSGFFREDKKSCGKI